MNMSQGYKDLTGKFSLYVSIPEINEEVMKKQEYCHFATSSELIHRINDDQWQSVSPEKT
jgi:hypothetical protein